MHEGNYSLAGELDHEAVYFAKNSLGRILEQVDQYKGLIIRSKNSNGSRITVKSYSVKLYRESRRELDPDDLIP